MNKANPKDWKDRIYGYIDDYEQSDTIAISILSIELAAYFTAVEDLKKLENITKKKELCKRKDAAFDKIIKLLRELKLTPAARKKIMQTGDSEPVDLAGELQ